MFSTLPVDSNRVDEALRRTIYRDAKREVRVGDLVGLFLDAGLRVFIVGGAPRDWLLGQPGRDIDLSLDRPLEAVHRLLREAHPDIDPVLLRLERFGTLRWGNEAGGVDLNILRSWKDIQNDEMWTTTFVAREDVREDALTRDFSINAFFYDCRERVLLDPLDCGLEDLHARRLRLITHPRVLDTSYRTTFRILQFLCRGYTPRPTCWSTWSATPTTTSREWTDDCASGFPTTSAPASSTSTSSSAASTLVPARRSPAPSSTPSSEEQTPERDLKCL
ncbi:CCA tRNA nucleotidyltransferase [Cystobacter fuscus]